MEARGGDLAAPSRRKSTGIPPDLGLGSLQRVRARKIGGSPAAGAPLARPGWSAGGIEKAGSAHSDEATGARDQNLGAWLRIRHAFCLCVLFTPSRFSCVLEQEAGLV
jgi:hypothetical protein